MASAQPDLLGGDVDYLQSADFLAAVLGVSRRQVYNYVDQGMPTVSRGRIDLRAAVQWWADQIKSPAKASTEITARAQLAIAQREKVMLETAKMRAELIPAADVSTAIGRMATAIAEMHDGFAPRIADELSRMDDPREIRNYLFSELRGMRAAIASAVETMAAPEPTEPAPPKRRPRVKRAGAKTDPGRKRANNPATA